MRRNLLLISLLAGLALLAGCAKYQVFSATSEGGSYNIEVKVLLNGGPVSGRNPVEIKLTDSAGKPVDGADVDIRPWMPDMGHGVMGIPRVTGSSGGIYKATVFLSMPGLWELRIKISAGGEEDKAVVLFPDVKE